MARVGVERSQIEIGAELNYKHIYNDNQPGRIVQGFEMHGTDLEAFAEIFKDRRLKADASSSPKGVYGVLAPADGEEFLLGAGFAFDAVIIGFEMHGCPLNLSQYTFWGNSIPEGVMGYPKRLKATATGGKSDTWVGHEAGCVVRHIYVKQKLLQQFLDEELDRCGYSKKYHEMIRLGDGELLEVERQRLAAE